MAATGTAARVPAMAQIHSGAAVFRTDPYGWIADWNPAAERLTGIPASEAVGRPCWDVIAGRDDDGALLCHPGCSAARLAREGWPVRSLTANTRTHTGTRRFVVSTIVVDGDVADEAIVLHTLHAAAGEAEPVAVEPQPALTRRQRQILCLLAEGVRARQIAARLRLSETTVRNHIQAILLALGVHSQLEAVARAHTLALADDDTAA
jgi:PAS domain S-box-containing protein